MNAGSPITGSSGLANPQNENAQPDPDKELIALPVVVTDQPSGLPAWLDVRKSAAHGRGLYAKDALAPGERNPG